MKNKTIKEYIDLPKQGNTVTKMEINDKHNFVDIHFSNGTVLSHKVYYNREVDNNGKVIEGWVAG